VAFFLPSFPWYPPTHSYLPTHLTCPSIHPKPSSLHPIHTYLRANKSIFNNQQRWALIPPFRFSRGGPESCMHPHHIISRMCISIDSIFHSFETPSHIPYHAVSYHAIPCPHRVGFPLRRIMPVYVCTRIRADQIRADQTRRPDAHPSNHPNHNLIPLSQTRQDKNLSYDSVYAAPQGSYA